MICIVVASQYLDKASSISNIVGQNIVVFCLKFQSRLALSQYK